MKIILAKGSGFCFGVKRAVDIASKTAGEQGNNTVYTLGPLIHNTQVTDELEKMGICSANLEDIPDNSTVIIRTHGIAPEVYEALLAKGLKVIDATCPFVKKIHNIVKEHHNNGYDIIIFGDPNHPEVQGINGWCGYGAKIIQSADELRGLLPLDRVCIVAQTTSSKEIWEEIKKIAKTSCQKVLIFDTICNATYERQSKAKEIAQQSDCMIVIGGRHSSNTKKLFDICSASCAETYHIETASELPKSVFDKHVLGVTAGASTPDWIIKEVISIMSEEKTQVGELSFAEELENSLVNPKTGDIVKGTVISITPTEIYVDLGFKADGVIPVDQLAADPDVKPEDILKVGDEVEAFVYRVSDTEGVVGLSVKKLSAIAGKKKLEEALESREVLKGKVVEVVNGGVIVLAYETRIFVPASQASERYLQDLNTLLGQEVSFRVIEINPRKRKIIGSIKSVASEVRSQQLDAFWAEAEVGKQYEGVVKSITDFGVFVDIGGVDGLVHISELSWERIKHPSEILSVGDKINVYIIALNKEKNKISLGFKKNEDNPWIKAQEMFNVGDVVKAKIVRLVAFGAFAELLPSVDGLIHISQISVERIAKPSSVLSIGQEVEAKITSIDWENKKISLSMRALVEPETPETEEATADEDKPAEEISEDTVAPAEAPEAVETAEATDDEEDKPDQEISEEAVVPAEEPEAVETAENTDDEDKPVEEISEEVVFSSDEPETIETAEAHISEEVAAEITEDASKNADEDGE
ncbi:MAG: 30S ribosomal protein S1 [Firmicutes bacterium ADurb.Bin193]|nr:MAG: 30S ribosomal protein S1 [Firmicutes bacterium ADurb.Bin193]